MLRRWRRRWQIPAILLGLAAFIGGARLLYRPQQPPPPNEEIARIARQRAEGLFDGRQAQDALVELGNRRPEARELAAFWMQMGLAQWQMLAVASRDGHAPPELTDAVIGSFRNALGRKPPQADAALADRRLGEAYRLAGRLDEAAAALRAALAAGVPEPWRVQRELLDVEFDRGRLKDAEDIARQIEANAAAGAYDRNWAAARRLELMIGQGRSKEVIDELAGDWQSRPPRIQLAYGRALWAAGRGDDAEPVLRAVREAAMADADPEVDGVAAYLLGRILYADGQGSAPEAEAFFRVDVDRYAGAPIELAGLWGVAQAAATLQEYPRSLETYRQLIGELRARGRNEWLAPDKLSEDLALLWERFDKAADYADAVRVAELLIDLAGPADEQAVELLARTLRSHAGALAAAAAATAGPDAADLRARARARYKEAAERFGRLSELQYQDDPKFQAARWQAIQCLERTDDVAGVISLLEQFVADKPQNNPLLPEALRMLGEQYYNGGRFEQAAAVLRRNIEDAATCKSPGSYASYVPLARCYLSMGRDEYPQAEQVLLRVLEGHVPGIGPDSENFIAASFLLGEVYYRMGDFERALQRFAVAVGMYPDDPQVVSARYYVADCYRRQAVEARDEVPKTAKQELRDRLVEKMTTFFLRAAETFRQVIDALGADTPDDGGVRATYLRNACFFEADCLYELGRYSEAIDRYEDAVFRFRNRLESVLACVSLSNACQKMGFPDRGTIYVRRGLKLLEKLPDSEFVRFRGLYQRATLEAMLTVLLRSL